MRSFLAHTVSLLVSLLYDLYIEIPDWFRIARKKHLEIIKSSVPDEKSEKDFSRTAIVAIYPSAESIPFTVNLLAALRQLQFRIVVISTKRLSADISKTLLANCDQLIERQPIGRDFGAYKLGLNLLKEWGVYDRIDTLILANDSMFYQAGFASVVAKIVGPVPTWGAIFENFEYHYHVQSFFQAFGREVLSSGAFNRFWTRYIPLSSRRHAIDQGEVGLSQALRRAGFQPATYYTSKRILDSFLGHLGTSNDLLPLQKVLQAQFGRGYSDIARHSVSQPAKEAGDGMEADPLRDRDTIAEFVRNIAERTERFNPTHSVGLLCNFLCGAPVKRDIAYRGVVTMGELLQLASGYSTPEIAAMETDMRARGTPAMFRGLKRLLFTRGRL